ncbi:universal stress protein [Sphingobium nicotianae]|uniref:Universal stress protein n=1 Tax=Sphingobium nicotianae TaxID=2782607 RepID=A0A9X1DDR0_9SPHN|nr:universal stress protein [Sphingobium nicotianae]MBT2188350.1 universal stress protein [Sphingobium nicotianae]
MKNILLLVHEDAGQEARLQAALDLTRALGGHLRCVDVSMMPAFAGDYYYGAIGEAMVFAEEQERESKNKSKLEARLASEDVSWDWVDYTGSLAQGVQDSAALADLIVLNRKLDTFPYPDMREVASQVLVHGRRPVVAVPDELDHFALGRALVAWDGQASSAEAMRSCVPLLALASEVEIFMIRDGAEQIEPTEAAEYLSRHGIHASVMVIEDGLTAPDYLIAAECARWHADYVVMGAYGHGRMMETFGGVTKRMLADSKLPLILAH